MISLYTEEEKEIMRVETPFNSSFIKGRQRVVITNVYPEMDDGQFPIKKIQDQKVVVEADIFADGHDLIACSLLYKHKDEVHWQEVVMQSIENDRWQGSFKVQKLGIYYYTLKACIDEFSTWQFNLEKKMNANQQTNLDFEIGALLIAQALSKAIENDQIFLKNYLDQFNNNKIRTNAIFLSKELAEVMRKYNDTETVTSYKELMVRVERKKAEFSAWYEVFPRSLSKDKNVHGTFKDLSQYLYYIKELGFDVVYLPPIHPIGLIHRKGKNNKQDASNNDPGSPWAIGNKEGGHMDIHQDLGTLEDFKKVLTLAKEFNLEIALDLALQCSPDHPYLVAHPEWFKKRPDGSLQYAENPPKKYEDIYPLDFSTEQWPSLWEECKKIVLYWIDQGIKIFRVDNPHTKPFVFWEWLIKEIKIKFPEVIFLAEAFTRPKIMHHLAKLGFTQSYTYFTWRNTKSELETYFKELSEKPIVDYFITNLWTNTPDILSEFLQKGGLPAFSIRYILAATLGSNYGIYGPSFELGLNIPLHKGSEEYLNSEKYELKGWQTIEENVLIKLIKKVNNLRKNFKALQNLYSLKFHKIDNQQLICYSKRYENQILLIVVNLDYQYKQCGWINFSLDEFDIVNTNYTVHELLTDNSYEWINGQNYIELDPNKLCAHIFFINTNSR